MGDHDALFKRIFSVPSHAAGELRSVLPLEIVEAIDLSRLELLSGASISDGMDARQADLVFRAPLREISEDGQTEYAYIRVQLHVVMEHQSQPDMTMPLRGLEYSLGLWHQALRDDPGRKTLPPVITIVVHHGPGGWTAPRSVHEMVEGLDRFPGLAAYVPNLRILIDDLAYVGDTELLARPLLPVPKAAVWLLRDGRQVDALLAHVPAWKEVLQEVFIEAPDVGMVFLRYISRIVTDRPFEDVRRVIHDNVAAAEAPLRSIAEELMQKGRQEGRQEGATDALRHALRMLLEQRFGPLEPSLEARISAADVSELNGAMSRVMHASDASSVLLAH